MCELDKYSMWGSNNTVERHFYMYDIVFKSTASAMNIKFCHAKYYMYNHI